MAGRCVGMGRPNTLTKVKCVGMGRPTPPKVKGVGMGRATTQAQDAGVVAKCTGTARGWCNGKGKGTGTGKGPHRGPEDACTGLGMRVGLTMAQATTKAIYTP